jgi:hypothetical protein
MVENSFWQNGTSKNRILRKGIRLFLKRHYLQTPKVGQSISTATRFIALHLHEHKTEHSFQFSFIHFSLFLLFFSFFDRSVNFQHFPFVLANA